MKEADVILASASPRRAELLRQIGVNFQVCSADIDETVRPEESPEDYVKRVAMEKALEVHETRQSSLPVLAADTSVILDNQVLGKPASRSQASDMLLALAGREHRVITAVAIRCGQQQSVLAQISRVTFADMTEKQVAALLNAGDYRDKAGAYAIQGAAAAFIQNLSGSYSGVMGLPLFETRQLLDQYQVPYFR